jgi:hypothetical protein
MFKVSIIVDEPLEGFIPLDEEDFIREYLSNSDISSIINEINSKYGITEMSDLDKQSDYAMYDAEADGVCFTINIEME